MAQIHRKVVETPLHCSHSVFYEVFRTEANLLPTVSPQNVKKIELVCGLESFNDEVVAIDREAHKITYRVLEGNLMMQLYHSFVATLEVKPGTAKWTIEFQKKNELCPDPDIYLQRLDSVSKDLDRYLSPKKD
ncbi:MLP protein [Salix suchowensis]|nr:MLP protein [Salix suchowensis]